MVFGHGLFKRVHWDFSSCLFLLMCIVKDKTRAAAHGLGSWASYQETCVFPKTYEHWFAGPHKGTSVSGRMDRMMDSRNTRYNGLKHCGTLASSCKARIFYDMLEVGKLKILAFVFLSSMRRWEVSGEFSQHDFCLICPYSRSYFPFFPHSLN